MLAEDKRGNILQAATLPPLAEQNVAITAGSVASTAFTASTRSIRIYASVNCRVAVGSSPTASSTSLYIPGGKAEYFGVRPGQKIAVIGDSTTGSMNVVEFD